VQVNVRLVCGTMYVCSYNTHVYNMHTNTHHKHTHTHTPSSHPSSLLPSSSTHVYTMHTHRPTLDPKEVCTRSEDTCIHKHIYVYTNTHTYTYIYIYMRICTQTHIRAEATGAVLPSLDPRMCIHTYTAYIHTRTYTYTYTYTHTYTHTCRGHWCCATHP